MTPLALEPVPPGASIATETTSTSQTSSVLPVPSWLSRHLRNVILLGVTGMVIYLAFIGEEQARQSLYGVFATLAGMMFGERAALKVPGKES